MFCLTSRWERAVGSLRDSKAPCLLLEDTCHVQMRRYSTGTIPVLCTVTEGVGAFLALRSQTQGSIAALRRQAPLAAKARRHSCVILCTSCNIRCPSTSNITLHSVRACSLLLCRAMLPRRASFFVGLSTVSGWLPSLWLLLTSARMRLHLLESHSCFRRLDVLKAGRRTPHGVQWTRSRPMMCSLSPACSGRRGDEQGAAATLIEILLVCTAPMTVLKHSLGAVICEVI